MNLLTLIVGNETKLGMSRGSPEPKLTALDAIIDKLTAAIFILQIFVVVILGFAGNIWNDTQAQKVNPRSPFFYVSWYCSNLFVCKLSMSVMSLRMYRLHLANQYPCHFILFACHHVFDNLNGAFSTLDLFFLFLMLSSTGTSCTQRKDHGTNSWWSLFDLSYCVQSWSRFLWRFMLIFSSCTLFFNIYSKVRII